MWPYGSASSVWTCPLNSGQIWKYPEVLGIEKSVHLLLRIQFSIPKVEPIRSKNNIFIQKIPENKFRKLTKMPPGVCSQLAYFRINRCGIFFGWNMSVVWTFWPNGIILHLDFDAFVGLSETLDRVVRGPLYRARTTRPRPSGPDDTPILLVRHIFQKEHRLPWCQLVIVQFASYIFHWCSRDFYYLKKCEFGHPESGVRHGPSMIRDERKGHENPDGTMCAVRTTMWLDEWMGQTRWRVRNLRSQIVAYNGPRTVVAWRKFGFTCSIHCSNLKLWNLKK